MDVETINRLSLVPPPLHLRDKREIAPSNSIAVSSFGDVLIISEMGEIVLVPIRPAASSSSTANASSHLELPFENKSDRELIKDCEFTNISFNRDNSAVLLWSPTSIGVIEIPRSLMLNGSIDPCCKKGKKCTFFDFSKHLSLGKNPNSTKLLKVICHPWSSHHIVALQQHGPLTVIDIVNRTVQAISLNSRYNFTSFCFGPDVDWMAVSVLLVTDTADIFAVCPVLPRGCPVAVKNVNAMKDWLEEQERYVIELAHGSSRRGGYFERAWKYCNEAFGAANLSANIGNTNQNTNSSSPYASDGRRLKEAKGGVIAGIGKDSALSRAQGVTDEVLNANSMFATSPKLQGPFSVSCVPAASRREEREKRGVVATDICTPRCEGRRGVPVVCVSYSSGLVDVLIFRSDGIESFYVGPSWLHCTNAVLRPAELLFVESVGGIDNSNSSGNEMWTIEPDPIFGHIFHLTNRSSCSSFLLSSPWLSKAIDEGNNAASSHKSDESSFVQEEKNTFDSSGGNSILQSSLLTPVFTPSSAGPLIGFAIVYDPMIGHISLFRKGDGKTAAVNLTVHVRLCELQKTFKRCEEESSGALASFTNDLDALVGRQDMAREREVSQLCSICDGLYNIPTYTSDVGTPQGAKEIASVVAHLESTVLLPLEELGLRMHMRLESLQEAWAIQHDLVMGGSRGGGLLAELEGLQSGSSALRDRISAINRRFEEQKGDVENNASLVYLTKSKVSKAERDYYRQLKEWESQIEKMNGALEPLQTLARSTLSSNKGQQHGFIGHGPISSGSPAAFLRQRLNIGALSSPARGPLTAHSSSAITPSKVLRSSALTPGSKSILSSTATSAAVTTVQAAAPRLNLSKETIEKCTKLLEAQERSIQELAGELNNLELSAQRR